MDSTTCTKFVFLLLFYQSTFDVDVNAFIQRDLLSHRHRHNHNYATDASLVKHHRRRHVLTPAPTSNYYYYAEAEQTIEYGNWGPWTVAAECSRSCGGGVAYDIRSCLDIRSDGVQNCRGASKRYYSCNMHECSEAVDFRAAQCSLFDSVPFDNYFYNWVPYTKSQNKCELNCMPRGERFYYRHKKQVIDGTRCDDERTDICVSGKCLPIGCDGMLGSPTREDKCRVCGGNGSSCNTITAVLDRNDLQVGYNDLLLIPAGATNIKIRELQYSSNYLAVRNLSNFYYLNGNWRIDFPRSLRFAGTVFHYDRNTRGFLAAESISALGPITESLYIVVLYQEKKADIEYEYSVANGSVKATDSNGYRWWYDEFSNCSVTCGEGFKLRNVWCAEKRNRTIVVSRDLCDPALEPIRNQSCAQEACPPRWAVGEWSKCSHNCGVNGTQNRTIWCERILSNGKSSSIDTNLCEVNLAEKPSTWQSCNMNVPCPKWYVGPWKACDKLCGEGYQKREVKCYYKNKGKITVVNDTACADPKPQFEKPCFVRPCEGVDWIVTEWSGCGGVDDDNDNGSDKCDVAFETRTAICSSAKGKSYPDVYCKWSKRPDLSRKCAGSGCKFQWYAAQWSECSSTCADIIGLQSRAVFCGQSERDLSIRKVNDSKCDANKKYDSVRECRGKAQQCGARWFHSSWSACSKPCGGGMRNRIVLCMMANKTSDVAKCGMDKIVFKSDTCNNHACNKDEVMVVLPGGMVNEENTVTNTHKSDGDEECEPVDDSTKEPDEDGSNTNTNGVMVTITRTKRDSKTNGVQLQMEMLTETTMAAAVHQPHALPTNEEIPRAEYQNDGMPATVQITVAETEMETETITVTDTETETETVTVTGTGTTETTTVDLSTTNEPSTTTFDVTTQPSFSSASLIAITSANTNSSTEATLASTVILTSETSPQLTSEPTRSRNATDTNDTGNESSTKYQGTAGVNSSSDNQMTPLVEGATTITTTNPTTTTTTTFGSLNVSPMNGNTTDTSNTDTVATTNDNETSTSFMNTTFSTISEFPTVTTDANTVSDVAGTVTTIITTTTHGTGTIVTDITTDTSVTIPSSSVFSSTEADTTMTNIRSSSEKLDDKGFTTLTGVTTTMNTTEKIAPTRKPCKTKRKKRPKCESSDYGCCFDGITAATGPFSAGCAQVSSCEETQYGCCPDQVTPAENANKENCVQVACELTLFGCCADNKSTALGNDGLGCPIEEPTTVFSQEPSSTTTTFDDNQTYQSETTTDEDRPVSNTTQGNTEPQLGHYNCTTSQFGCCSDNKTYSSGPNLEGCPDEMNQTSDGSGDDGTTFVTPNGSSITATTAGITITTIEDGQRDMTSTGTSIAPVQYPCSNTLYGCCPDNITSAEGPMLKGCGCEFTQFGCCSDGKTAAPNQLRACDCNATKYGCCPDGLQPAQGDNYAGCVDISKAAEICAKPRDKGSCRNFTVKWAFDTEYGDCARFWYGGCEGNDNRFNTQDECKKTCVEPPVRIACYLPKVAGPCDGYNPSWYYDSSRGQCLQFIYKGCLGNNNRFQTLQECESSCLQANHAVRAPQIEHPRETHLIVENQVYVTLQCKASGFPTPAIMWNKNGVPIDRSLDKYRLSTDGGRLQIVDLHADDSATYTCIAENGVGEPAFLNMQLTVKSASAVPVATAVPPPPPPPPTPTPTLVPVPVPVPTLTSAANFSSANRQPPRIDLSSPTEIEAEEGGYAVVECAANGLPAPSISWQRGTTIINRSEGRYKLNGGVLQVIGLRRNDAGAYICIADNGVGQPDRREYSLTIRDGTPKPADIISDQAASSVTVIFGEPAVLHCYAYGLPPPTVRWWKGKDQMLPRNSSQYEQRRDHSLIIRHITLKALGPYTCQAFNGLGKAASWTTILHATGPATPLDAEDLKFIVYVVLPSPSHLDPSNWPTPSSSKTWTKDTDRPTTTTTMTTTTTTTSTAPVQPPQEVYVSPDCTDNPFYANCSLIVKGHYCNHQYYRKFCCRSCTLGQQMQLVPVNIR